MPRKVSNALTVQYDRVMYLLADSVANRSLVHEYVEVVEYPDGMIEVQANGAVLSCQQYDRITRIDQGAEVENKRLSSALEVARRIQNMRDDRRASGSPSRTHCGAEVQAKKALIGLKKQRAIELADLNQAILEVSVKGIRERGAASPPHPNTINKDKTKPKHRDISI